MKQLGLSMKTVKAIFVSHEHGDHIKGVSTLANKYQLPVYITGLTAGNGPRLIKHLSKTFTANEPVYVGELSVIPFTKNHDAADPHSFVISYLGITVGVFTDIGTICKQVTHYFKQCHAAFLEANYDEEMLEKGTYPLHLKNRIRGDKGHLSNLQALELFKQHRPPFMSHLILSHLSKENNTAEIAGQLFMQNAKGTAIIVASRYQPTDVISITANASKEMKTDPVFKKGVQLGLFAE